MHESYLIASLIVFFIIVCPYIGFKLREFDDAEESLRREYDTKIN